MAATALFRPLARTPRRRSTRPGVMLAALMLAVLASGLLVTASHAQVSAPRNVRNTAGPAWSDLNASQRQALAPLAAKWGQLSEAHKRKWIALSQNYPRMAPAEQARLHSRMTEWVALSPQQRSTARLNFADVRQLDPQERRAQWEAYQSLSDEEKRKLAESARPKPVGAAVAAKPVPPQKLARVNKTKPGQASAAATGTVAAAPDTAVQLHQSTLLPQNQAAVPTPAQPH